MVDNMFIKTKKHASGRVSMYIVRKEKGKHRYLKTIGTVTDQRETKTLKARAQQALNELKQQTTLMLSHPQEEEFIRFLEQGLRSIEVAGFELILGKLFDQIGFNAIPEPLFRHLVLSRISNPGSKMRTVHYLLEHYGVNYNLDVVYRYLDKLHHSYKPLIQQISYQHTVGLFKEPLQVVFYDVTTVYFEAGQEDDLRRMGFSKDGKAQHPQIVLGLLVSQGGYPLDFAIFEGNTFEGNTLLPVLEKFQKQYTLPKAVVVADAGLLSSRNVGALVEAGYEFILGGRIKNETAEVKAQILKASLKEGQVYTIKKGKQEEGQKLRLLITYSTSRAKKDRKNRERGLKRLEKAVETGHLTKKQLNQRGYNKYLVVKGKASVEIDYEKFEQDARWDGLKGYLTNASLSDEEVLGHYGHLWEIEKAFRISKTDLRIRPIYHRLNRRIETHLLLSFCSYKVYKELERVLAEKKVGLTACQSIRLMQTIFRLKIRLPLSGQIKSLLHFKTKDHERLLKAFDVKF